MLVRVAGWLIPVGLKLPGSKEQWFGGDRDCPFFMKVFSSLARMCFPYVNFRRAWKHVDKRNV